MKLITAGESHGKAIAGILENVPSGFNIDENFINSELAARQSGYGRGGRQKIENDKINILSGIKNGKTTGAPIAFTIENKDYNAFYGEEKLTKVRPGHADLSGMIKYNVSDIRDIAERASARATAAIVAGGAVAKQFLSDFGISITGYVRSVYNIEDKNEYGFEQIKKSRSEKLRMMSRENEACAAIDALRENGDTAGGIVEIRVKGLKIGFGSCMEYGKKLDADLAAKFMSIQAVKGVEIGKGFALSKMKGSEARDAVFFDGNFKRKSNNSGGIEGGISDGEEIVIRAAMKPLPTVSSDEKTTVDFITKEETASDYIRSDTAAVTALEVILENAAALTVSDTITERLGGDNMEDITGRWRKLP